MLFLLENTHCGYSLEVPPFREVLIGSVVYNQAIVYKCQNFLKVAVHLIIVDQSNQTALLSKSSKGYL